MDDKVVFISHAGKDKKDGKITFLVDYLTKRNDEARADRKLKFFIDRPIDMGIDPVAAAQRGIIGLSIDPSDPLYKQQLRQQVRDCAFMIGVLSSQLTRERDIWNFELMYGFGDEKLVCCKIEEFELKVVNELLPELQWMDLSGDKESSLNGAQLNKLYDIIEKNVFGGRTGNTVSQNSSFRALPGEAALGIGRGDSRDEVRRSSEGSLGGNSITPVVISGPENELVLRIPEVLKLNHKLDISDRSDFHFHVEGVTWPEPGSPNFARDYRAHLAGTLMLPEDADDLSLSTAIQRFAHHFVPRSHILIDGYSERRRIADEIEAWAAFWANGTIRGGPLQGIAPLLLLAFDKASAGWDNDDPRVPPSPKEGRALHRQNRELLEALTRQFELGTPHALKIPLPPLRPVRRQGFYDWVDAIGTEYFDEDRKAVARDWYDDCPADPKLRNFGIPLRDLHQHVVGKLGALQSGGR